MMSKWISLQEESPPENERVIVLADNKGNDEDDPRDYIIFVGYWEYMCRDLFLKEWKCEGGDTCLPIACGELTHWMPRPLTPDEERRQNPSLWQRIKNKFFHWRAEIRWFFMPLSKKKLTIKWQLRQASPGDTIYIPLGKYTESLHLPQGVNLSGVPLP